jgi:hypothetical protein
MTAAQTHEGADPSMGLVERKHVKSQQPKCSARSSRTGKPCQRYPAVGATVCRVHGGAAPQVQKAARRRLEQAADVLVKRLLGLALDGAAPDHVALSAVVAALDRAGLSVKSTVGVEISAKPWESVFEGISKVISGPRDESPRPLAELPESGTAATELGDANEDGEIIGEFDDDPLPEDEIDDDQPRFQPVIDVEVVADEYTDAIMSDSSGTITPDQDQSQPGEHTALPFGPLGPTSPAGSGLMPLDAAIEAASVMRQREAARIRNARRR